MAVDCNSSSGKKLKMYGFRVPGQGFYAFDIPEPKLKTYQATGVLSILEGEATKDKVSKELKHLVKADWDFRVRMMDKQEYLVIFPDKSSLDTFTRLSEFGISLYGLKGRLEKANIDPESSLIL